jgi:ribokinase
VSGAGVAARPGAVVVGDLMVVTMGGVSRMPESGQNVVLRDPSVHVSGVGANVALNLRALGVEVSVVSAVGDDAVGDRVVGELQADGVDTTWVRRAAGTVTGSMVVMVEPDGERTMVGTRGASERFEFDAPSLLSACTPAWVHVSGYTLLDGAMAERCEALLAASAHAGIASSIDLEGGAVGGRPQLLERSVVFGNESECRACFGTDEPEALAAARAGEPGALVVKSGAAGCVLIAGSAITRVPAAGSVAGGDSTGAGDAFDAAFIAARIRGASLETACALANAAGARTARTRGPRQANAAGA